MKKLNLAIIGQGRSGRDIHGKYFLTDHAKELFNVVAVVDYIPERRARAAEEFGCDVYEDYRELFKRNDLDFVINSTFSKDHFPVTMDLLNHGMNVVCEKPFSRYAMQVEEMINTAKANNVMLTVFQQARLVKYHERTKEILESGKLGKIHQINIRFGGFGRRYDWQTSNRYYGGALLNTGPHPMDQALNFLNIPDDETPNVFSILRRMNSAGDAEDCAKIILTYPDKPIVDIEINSTNNYGSWVYNVYAEKGSLIATMGSIKWKYHNDKEMPKLDLEPLRGEDGVYPSYCSEELEWNEFEEELTGDAFTTAVQIYYTNVYNHLTKGEELLIKPERVLQQIRIMELVHSQNPMPTLY